MHTSVTKAVTKAGSGSILWTDDTLLMLGQDRLAAIRKASALIAEAWEIMENKTLFPPSIQSRPDFWTLTVRLLLLKLDFSRFRYEAAAAHQTPDNGA